MESENGFPVPAFFSETQPLSTKKANRLLRPTPKDIPPRKPVPKSTLLTSRLFQKRFVEKAHAISFRESGSNSLILNKHYDESRSELYFNQCFTVINVLGSGSFGKVFKVQCKEDGKFYAVKKSIDSFRGEQDRHNRLEEVKKHEQLPKHPNCVTFVKAWEERQYLYIQTELCETSLNVLAEQNNDIPEKLIWRYLVDLLQAVKHLHDHNLIHLDIKPANIFVSSHGICKLGDFGLVVDLTKDSQEPLEGDPKYMASELMSGTFTKAADIFSLGITLLELSCDLDLPQSGETWHQLRSGNLPLQFIKHLSHDLVSILSAMMSPNHSLRPTADQLLRHPAVCKVARWRNSELNLMEWVSYLYIWRSGWNIVVSLCTSLMNWLWSGRRRINHSLTSTPKRNIMDLDLSISDDDDPMATGTMNQVSFENLCVTPIKCLTNGCDNSNSDDELCKSFTMSGKRLFNSTPVHHQLPTNKEASSSFGVSKDRRQTTSKCDKSNLNRSLFEESSRYQMGPKNLLEAFDSMSDDDD